MSRQSGAVTGAATETLENEAISWRFSSAGDVLRSVSLENRLTGGSWIFGKATGVPDHDRHCPAPHPGSLVELSARSGGRTRQ
jgi:hypothetical protein